ncbi:hypothetical protein AX16_004835 [Volvariella volvacea WC 439]|nr:hypothetical protein AX16_004835 [Volvariella volvacea WC 439]
MNPRPTNSSEVRRTNAPSSSKIPSVHWLFRSNIPRRRQSYLPTDIRKRNLFGMSDILGVLTNPAETVRSLTESKRLLEEARREISEQRERSQLRHKRAFSRLPGFFQRPTEMRAVETALRDEPSFTVIFGANSVGKTALLREVLSKEKYHVLHFDLRIAGFADLSSLYLSLSQQMEQYFGEIAEKMEGFEIFEKEAWNFKHDRLSVEHRLAEAPEGTKARVKTSDVARLMELFQSSLLKYWDYEPNLEDKEGGGDRSSHPNSDATATERTPGSSKLKMKWGFRSRKGKERETIPTQSSQINLGKGKERPKKKMPVILFDEAHKLPSLIQSTDTMKCLLDSMLVLTKQDRLCHVIHATSDPFYQTWLRQFNVMHHCKIITIGDCNKAEMRRYFREYVIPRVPDHLKTALHFEELWDAFGGKLAHWQDYVADFINNQGIAVAIKQNTHFIQAHALLNLHIIHAHEASSSGQDGEGTQPPRAQTTSPDTLHPNLGLNFRSAYGLVDGPDPGVTLSHQGDRSLAMVSGFYSAEFTAMQLLKVMSRFTQPGNTSLSYFLLCRELGVRAVDGMVRGKVLDLRWTDPVTKENAPEDGRIRAPYVGSSANNTGMPGTVGGLSLPNGGPVGSNLRSSHGGLGVHLGQTSSATAIDMIAGHSEEDIMPVPDHELGRMMGEYENEEEEEDYGPKLVPISPIMRYAMREVVREYGDDQSVSEYASLSDVDEY